MSKLKTSLDAAGAGGGVTWSTYGILFATMSMAAGGVLSLATGFAFISLFSVISAVILYYSYQSLKKSEQKIAKKTQEINIKLKEEVTVYLKNIHDNFFKKNPEKTTKNFLLHLQDQLEQEEIKFRNNNRNSLANLLLFLKYELNNNDWLKSRFEEIVPFEIKVSLEKKAPFTKLFIAGFTGFMTGFGTVAGGSAGIGGLLGGMGLFAGFGSIPILGWSLLGLAFILGTIIAVRLIQKAKNDYQLQKTNKVYENLGQELEIINKNNLIQTTLEAVELPGSEREMVIEKLKMAVNRESNTSSYKHTAHFFSQEIDNESEFLTKESSCCIISSGQYVPAAIPFTVS